MTGTLATSVGDVLTTRALNRAFLARQLLLERAQMPVQQAIGHLLGLQAQAPTAPYFGLWSRLREFSPDRLAALIEDRTVVRIVVMRNTVHLVTADDALVLRPLHQEMLERGARTQQAVRPWIDRLDVGAVLTAARALLAERPRTVARLGADLALVFSGSDPTALGQLVRGFLPLVQLPPRGLWGRSGLPVCGHLCDWVDRPLAESPGRDQIVLRYLAAFGPASVLDFQAWSGLRRLTATFESLRARLRVFRDESGRELFDLPEAARPDPDVTAPVRLLAPYDNALLSHADRTRIMTDDDRRQIITVNGLVKGTLLVDGFARGYWEIATAGARSTASITPFRPLSKRHAAGVMAEAARLLRFAAPGAEHDVRIAMTMTTGS